MGRKLGLYSLIHSDDDDDGGRGFAWGERGADLSAYGLSEAHAKGGKPGPPGGGGAGGSTFPNYTTGTNDNIDDAQQYNITIVFKGSWTQPYVDVFTVAANTIVSKVTGDVLNISGIDDLQIEASLVNIDGPGRILGQAGPTNFRPDTLVGPAFSQDAYLPYTGIMQFDSADASNYQAQGLFLPIVLHEMLHTVGFGTVWTNLGLLDGAGTSTPTFIGTQATNAYAAIYPNEVAANLATWGAGVPVENGGGSGTQNSHWEDDIFHNELMTGYINNDGIPNNGMDNVLSDVTIASLGDLGYVTYLGATYESSLIV
jgi:hypothetical protein